MQRRSFLVCAGAAPHLYAARPDALTSLRDRLAARRTQSLLIVKDGSVVLEWYAPGRTAESTHYMASATKALVGGTSLLFAMNDGRIRANDPAYKYIPRWKNDPQRSKITIRHLATHTSGLEDSSVPGISHPNEPGWKGRFWKRNDPDPFTISLEETPLLFAPGEGYQYSNPGMAALGYAVTASLRGAPQQDIRSLLRERLMQPLGINDKQWQIGYNQPSRVDGLDLYATWGGSNFAPRATAKVAEWMMHKGRHAGRQLVAAGSVGQLLKYAGMRLPDRTKDRYAPASALCWYTNFDAVWPEAPRDAFVAAGAGHQLVLVSPSLNLIVVRNGGVLAEESAEPFWTAAYRHLFEPVMQALNYPARPAPPSYPASKVIRGVEFAPKSSIIRKAVDCDNWPMTWGDDDAIYTSYGDGWGFEPRVKDKLGMGFAKVEGNPPDFTGVNIRTATGERPGDGARSPKASGLIMVDRVLYAWVRNVGNAQLLWSPDYGKSWTWGFRVEHGFGSPSFLNFGKNNQGARDEYVYAYSQDGPSAYENDDGVVLARAHKARIKDQEAWQFCTGIGRRGAPLWSGDPKAARPVLEYPGHCQRVDAIYHPKLKRYLLAVAYGHNGGWGIFDAPEPWGPWSVAFHTEYWGLGETHGYRFCPKWISADGTKMMLVFSGLIYDGTSYDAFCVREMSLKIG